MKQVTVLKYSEIVRVDPRRVEELHKQLGESGAEDVICRALEELASRLSRAERCYREARHHEMRKAARSVVAIADQIGMSLLAKVALDVALCIDAGDGVALSATMTRLLRIGESSLTEIWDLQDLSI